MYKTRVSVANNCIVTHAINITHSVQSVNKYDTLFLNSHIFVKNANKMGGGYLELPKYYE